MSSQAILGQSNSSISIKENRHQCIGNYRGRVAQQKSAEGGLLSIIILIAATVLLVCAMHIPNLSEVPKEALMVIGVLCIPAACVVGTHL